MCSSDLMETIVFLSHESWHHFPHMSNTVEVFEKSLPESFDDRSDLFSLETAVTTS